ncbi:protein FAM9A-like isoform X2 [Amphiprion ocellaris]|uniref:protein FAM9A-like isoform X2 n=1 Tax=Amphiprion ocellaris TaxID=80972 RepID=UPI0024117BD7|nr:protein FAM9A-like isoform X2 [Amphiprion ocellaris]
MFAVASTSSPAAATAAAMIEKEAEVQGESEEKEEEEEEEEDGGRDVTQQGQIEEGIFGVKVYLSLMWSLHVFLFYHSRSMQPFVSAYVPFW